MYSRKGQKDYSIAQALKTRDATAASASASGSLSAGSLSESRWWQRTAWLVLVFWTLVLSMVLCYHVVTASSSGSSAALEPRHHAMPLTLNGKLNALMFPSTPWDAILSYRICCRFPGGHMECPDAKEMECHVLRDQGPRISCPWLAPRLEGAKCTLYWVTAAAPTSPKS